MSNKNTIVVRYTLSGQFEFITPSTITRLDHLTNQIILQSPQPKDKSAIINVMGAQGQVPSNRSMTLLPDSVVIDDEVYTQWYYDFDSRTTGMAQSIRNSALYVSFQLGDTNFPTDSNYVGIFSQVTDLPTEASNGTYELGDSAVVTNDNEGNLINELYKVTNVALDTPVANTETYTWATTNTTIFQTTQNLTTQTLSIAPSVNAPTPEIEVDETTIIRDKVSTLEGKVSNLENDATNNPKVKEDLRSEEHTSELQSHSDLVCRLLLEKKNKKKQE